MFRSKGRLRRCLSQNGAHPRDSGSSNASETCNAPAIMKRVIETQWMPVLVLASCFAQALRRRNGERMWESKQERKKDASEGEERERERVREGRNTALAQLCGTFDMSFEPSLITWAKTNTWAEKSYVLFESSSSSCPSPLPRLNRDCSWHTCSFCNCWNVKLSPTLMWNYNLHKQLSLVKNNLLSLLFFSAFFLPSRQLQRFSLFFGGEQKHFQFELFISGSQKASNHKWSFQAP